MHKLVRAWEWEQLDAAEQQEYGISSLQLVYNAIQLCDQTPQAKLRLLAHAVANFTATTRHEHMFHASATLAAIGWVEKLGHFADGTGQLSETFMFEAFTYGQMKAVLGQEHPSTLIAMSNLAGTLNDQGKMDEAAAMKSEALNKMRSKLGNDGRYCNYTKRGIGEATDAGPDVGTFARIDAAHPDNGALIGALERLASAVLVLSGKIDLMLDKCNETDENILAVLRGHEMIQDRLKTTDEPQISSINSRLRKEKDELSGDVNEDDSRENKRKADDLDNTADARKRQKRIHS
ncbi:hypothetical protein EJ05DRAFT_505838 [Pseudovirgaria hyperparasitica]|uniref:Uncharacterized protein n=1 Tax=Pseudovirgaria hyperparasitica TaxID=470096 RepID=A0A6A6VR94_9PEZI|nr:uncharacterized protein EJ05DRAFT_505838 [Pseudovirgaria hyperparasitica]KAF2752665.1 hypothetical protein EJ05DRAFT_505838 [Pseudovirgaria hyperparasitica]